MPVRIILSLTLVFDLFLLLSSSSVFLRTDLGTLNALCHPTWRQVPSMSSFTEKEVEAQGVKVILLKILGWSSGQQPSSTSFVLPSYTLMQASCG